MVKLNEDIINKAKSLRNEGMTYRQIAEELVRDKTNDLEKLGVTTIFNAISDSNDNDNDTEIDTNIDTEIDTKKDTEVDDPLKVVVVAKDKPPVCSCGHALRKPNSDDELGDYADKIKWICEGCMKGFW